MGDYKSTLTSLFETWASLSSLGASLNETQWKTPTQCPGWSVQDNMSHIIGVERMLGGLAGTAHRATTFDHVKNSIGEINEHEVDSRRPLQGAHVLKEFEEITATRRASLEAADESFFTQETTTPLGKNTMAEFLHLRTMDCWVHEQDMRRALSIPGSQDSSSAVLSVDRLCRALPMVVGKRAGTPEGGSVVVHITGPIHRHITLTVTNGRAAVVDAVPDSLLAEISFDSNTFVELATGRSSAREVQSKYQVTGDTALGERVIGALNMMI